MNSGGRVPVPGRARADAPAVPRRAPEPSLDGPPDPSPAGRHRCPRPGPSRLGRAPAPAAGRPCPPPASDRPCPPPAPAGRHRCLRPGPPRLGLAPAPATDRPCPSPGSDRPQPPDRRPRAAAAAFDLRRPPALAAEADARGVQVRLRLRLRLRPTSASGTATRAGSRERGREWRAARDGRPPCPAPTLTSPTPARRGPLLRAPPTPGRRARLRRAPNPAADRPRPASPAPETGGVRTERWRPTSVPYSPSNEPPHLPGPAHAPGADSDSCPVRPPDRKSVV